MENPLELRGKSPARRLPPIRFHPLSVGLGRPCRVSSLTDALPLLPVLGTLLLSALFDLVGEVRTSLGPYDTKGFYG